MSSRCYSYSFYLFRDALKIYKLFILILPKVLLESTPKRVQANYVMWRVAGASVSYLTDNLRRRQLAYVTALSGKTERESRWKECADTTSVRYVVLRLLLMISTGLSQLGVCSKFLQAPPKSKTIVK